MENSSSSRTNPKREFYFRVIPERRNAQEGNSFVQIFHPPSLGNFKTATIVASLSPVTIILYLPHDYPDTQIEGIVRHVVEHSLQQIQDSQTNLIVRNIFLEQQNADLKARLLRADLELRKLRL